MGCLYVLEGTKNIIKLFYDLSITSTNAFFGEVSNGNIHIFIK